MVSLGTLKWIEETGGKLTRRDRLVITGEAVLARLSSRLSGRAVQVARHLEIDQILPPDTPMAKAAEALSSQSSEPYLFNHCLRAYFWARLYNGRRAIDDEALYVALLLHDLGLTEAHRLKRGEGECFTIVGAKAVERLARQHSWSDKRTAMAADAITLHLNVTVDAKHGMEAKLVRFGSGADVAGLGISRIPEDQRTEILSRFPRLNMKSNIRRDLALEVCERPNCRIAYLFNAANFGGLISNAPFDE